MTKYSEKNLQNNETIVCKAKISLLSAFDKALPFLICLAIAIVVFAFTKTVAGNIAFKGAISLAQKVNPNASAQQIIDEILSNPESLEGADNILQVYSKISMVMTLIGVFFIIVGTLPLVMKIIDLLCTDIAITNKRVIDKCGIIKVKVIDLHIDKVDTVNISATFWGRIFKYYKLSVVGSGAGEPVWFNGVSNANQFKNMVNNAIEQHAEDARKAQAMEMAQAMAKK